MIILYKGARGRGKTLTMVKDGLQFKNDGFKVLANFHVTYAEYIENEDILNLDKNSELYNCVIMIDEIQIFYDSRRSMAKQNITFSNFVQQIRKRGILILCTTQFSNTVDSRLRQHLDIVAFPNFISKYNVCVVTYMDLTRLEDNEAMNLFGLEVPKPMTAKIVFNAEPIFKLYNTSEMIT